MTKLCFKIKKFLFNVPLSVKVFGAFAGLVIVVYFLIEFLHHVPFIDGKTIVEVGAHPTGEIPFLAHFSWLTLLAILIPALLSAWVVFKWTLKPIQQLNQSIEKVISGELDHQIELRSEDELGQLTQKFNNMVTELQQYRAEIKRSNEELSQFASVVSHDLKEPLRKIIFYCKSLSEDNKIVPASQDKIEKMSEVGQRMQSLLTDLLEFSRAFNKKMAVKPVDLNIIIKEILEDFEHCIHESKAKIEVHELPTIGNDPMQMRVLFQNLIGNAIKYRREGVPPEITIRGEDKGPHFKEIVIADNGIGLPKGAEKKIFEPFQRLDNASTYEGSGLGLATVKRIVDRSQGLIHALSREGKGSIFAVALPNQLQTEQIASYQQQTVGVIHKHFPESAVSTILLAEDMAHYQAQMKQALAGLNVAYIFVDNGQSAIEAFKKYPMNLVLMDCDMPVKDGFQATEAIRDYEAQAKKNPTPIIAYSQTVTEQDRLLYEDAGMNDHLRKGFTIEELVACLKKWGNYHA